MPLTMDERPSEEQAVATVHAALDAGVTLIDTADAYGPSGDGPGCQRGAGRASRWRRTRARPKTSSSRPRAVTPATPTEGGVSTAGRRTCARPARGRCAGSGSTPSTSTSTTGPIPTCRTPRRWAGCKDLYDAGLVRRVGISNADPDQIRLAQDDPRRRPGGRAEPVLAALSQQRARDRRLRRARAGVPAVEPAGRDRPRRRRSAGRGRSSPGSAATHDVSPQQVCLAWELQLSPVVIPIPGASRPASIVSSAAAVHVRLTAEDMARAVRVCPDLRDPRKLTVSAAAVYLIVASASRNLEEIPPDWEGAASGTPNPIRRVRRPCNIWMGAGDPCSTAPAIRVADETSRARPWGEGNGDA